MKLNYLKTIYYNLINNIFVICFALILLLISLNHYIVFVILFGYLYYIFKKDKKIFIISIIICLLVLIIYLLIKSYQEYLINNNNNNIIGKIIELETKTNYQKITIKYKIFKVNVLDYDFLNLELGEKILIKGIINEIDTNHIPNAFNYNEYFYNNLFLYEIKANYIEVIDKQLSVYKISQFITNYIDYFFEGDCAIVMKGFIIGETKGFDESFNEALRVNGIIHLFAISGSHIVLLISIFEYLFKKTKSKNKIINFILLLYLFITKFSISISRAIFTYYLHQLFQYKNIKFTSLDTSCIVFIIFIIINPFLMYNLGFVLSFIATFLIILISDNIKKLSNIKSILVITLVVNIFALPLSINLNNEINILSPIINVLMILLVEGLLIPLSFFVFIFPIFNFLYQYIIIAFIYLNNIISEMCYNLGFVITIKSLSFIILIIYYLLLFLVLIIYSKKLKYKKILYMIILFIIILLFSNLYCFTPTITFLDLYKGESTLIEYKEEIILIDTGEGIQNEVSSFLRTKGIKKIDYLILTHNHSDHNGEAKYIINNFNVTNIVISEYDNSEFSRYNNVIKLKQGNTLQTHHLTIHCLFPNNKSDNINNDSLVLYFNIKNISFLFCGDIEQEIENEFSKMNVDILKVSHHGSNTSTSNSFLNKIKPKYSIIMTGRSNSFEFPSNDVINRLKNINSIIYCTKDNYTITLKIKNKKCIFMSLKETI